MNGALLRLILSQVFLHTCMAGVRMAAPLWALRQGFSEASVGVLLALFALTQVFFSIPAGRYTDRVGVRKPVSLGVVCASVGAGLAVAFPSFPVLCLSALMTGGATGLASIALQRHVGRIASNPVELRQLYSWFAIGPAISNFIGPFTTGLLIDHAGFHWAFLAMALLPVLSWLFVRRTRELPPVHVPEGAARPRVWDLLHEPMLRRMLIVNWFLASCWDVHTFVVPVLGHERGFSASAIGSILGAFAVAAAGIRILLPMLATRISERAVIAGAMVITSGLFGIYPLLPTPWAMGLCSVGLGFALGSVQPMVMSLLHQMTPHNRHGEVLGLRLMAVNASSVVMPLLFGAAGSLVGVAVVFWAVGAVVGAGSRMALQLGVRP